MTVINVLHILTRPFCQEVKIWKLDLQQSSKAHCKNTLEYIMTLKIGLWENGYYKEKEELINLGGCKLHSSDWKKSKHLL